MQNVQNSELSIQSTNLLQCPVRDCSKRFSDRDQVHRHCKNFKSNDEVLSLEHKKYAELSVQGREITKTPSFRSSNQDQLVITIAKALPPQSEAWHLRPSTIALFKLRCQVLGCDWKFHTSGVRQEHYDKYTDVFTLYEDHLFLASAAVKQKASNESHALQKAQVRFEKSKTREGRMDIDVSEASVKFICKVAGCGKSFDTQTNLNSHYNSVKNDNIFYNEHKVFAQAAWSDDDAEDESDYELESQCPVDGCIFKFSSKSKLILHHRAIPSSHLLYSAHQSCINGATSTPTKKGKSLRRGVRSNYEEIDPSANQIADQEQAIKEQGWIVNAASGWANSEETRKKLIEKEREYRAEAERMKVELKEAQAVKRDAETRRRLVEAKERKVRESLELEIAEKEKQVHLKGVADRFAQMIQKANSEKSSVVSKVAIPVDTGSTTSADIVQRMMEGQPKVYGTPISILKKQTFAAAPPSVKAPAATSYMEDTQLVALFASSEESDGSDTKSKSRRSTIPMSQINNVAAAMPVVKPILKTRVRSRPFYQEYGNSSEEENSDDATSRKRKPTNTRKQRPPKKRIVSLLTGAFYCLVDECGEKFDTESSLSSHYRSVSKKHIFYAEHQHYVKLYMDDGDSSESLDFAIPSNTALRIANKITCEVKGCKDRFRTMDSRIQHYEQYSSDGLLFEEHCSMVIAEIDSSVSPILPETPDTPFSHFVQLPDRSIVFAEILGFCGNVNDTEFINKFVFDSKKVIRIVKAHLDSTNSKIFYGFYPPGIIEDKA